MYIYIDFYKQFQCIGQKCQNSCCCGWDISFDPSSTQYYQNLKGEFGDFIRQNIYWDEKKGMTFVKMTPERKCPLLDENGLCRIYIECGEEQMSTTCKVFPRSKLDLAGNSMRGFSMSCEEVLRMLYYKSGPVHLCAEGRTDIQTIDDLSTYELSQFIGWGMEMLQDETIPFSVGLATVLTVGSEVETPFINQDFESFESVILHASDLQDQFMQAGEALTSDMREFAWKLIFGITDTFCHIINESDAFEKDTFLWPQELFHMDDSQRRSHLVHSWNDRKDDPVYLRFLRRLAAAYFQSHSMALGHEPAASIYIRDICNYLVLARILPLTWTDCACTNDLTYFSRFSHLAHHFEQSTITKKFVWPVIQDLFSPDLYTYAMAFMVLFEEKMEYVI